MKKKQFNMKLVWAFDDVLHQQQKYLQDSLKPTIIQWSQEHWPAVTASLQNDPGSMASTFMEILQVRHGNDEDMTLWLVASLFHNRTMPNEVTVIVMTTEEKAMFAYKSMEKSMEQQLGTPRNPIH